MRLLPDPYGSTLMQEKESRIPMLHRLHRRYKVSVDQSVYRRPSTLVRVTVCTSIGHWFKRWTWERGNSTRVDFENYVIVTTLTLILCELRIYRQYYAPLEPTTEKVG